MLEGFPVFHAQKRLPEITDALFLPSAHIASAPHKAIEVSQFIGLVLIVFLVLFKKVIH